MADAYETDTVAGVSALLAKLNTFLLANNWEVLRNDIYATGTAAFTNYGLIFRSKGFLGTDYRYYGIELETDDAISAPSYANLKLQHFTSYDGTLTNDNQDGAIPNPPKILSEISDDFDYHFVINDNRLIIVTTHTIVAAVVHEIAYLGGIKAYGTIDEYQNMVLVGGSAHYDTADGMNAIADVNRSHSAFFNPYSSSTSPYSTPFYYDTRTSCMLRYNGLWKGFINGSYLSASYTYLTERGVFPYASNKSATRYWLTIAKTEDDDIPMFPIILMDRKDGADIIYGELDGVFAVTGGLATTDTLTQGGYNYLIVQNAWRSGLDYELCAVKIDAV